VKVGLVTRSGLLPQHTLGARALAAKAMRDKGPGVCCGLFENNP